MEKHINRNVAVVGIGGNSLIIDKQHQTVKDQYQAAKETTYHIADMIEAGWNVVIGHGNGPQVGFILRRSEIANRVEGLHEVPLDACGADTQGAIGYALQQNLQNELRRRNLEGSVTTVVTQVAVDPNDPALMNPSKPIGSFMEADEAKRRARENDWEVVEDAGRGWRRVVPSPIPQKILELDAIKNLVDAGIITIAVGGGGIPVVQQESGDYQGIAAVIDKDYACSLLGQLIQAEMLLISTSVEKVALNYGKPNQEWVDRMTLKEAKRYLEEGIHFAPGSMAPKIQAIVWFLEAGGRQAIVTNPQNISRALEGKTGTHFMRAENVV